MYDFLKKCFSKNPDDRPTASELLSHPWIQTHQNTDNENHHHPSSFTTLGTSILDSDRDYSKLEQHPSHLVEDSIPSKHASTSSNSLDTAPNTPHLLDDDNHADYPPWIEKEKEDYDDSSKNFPPSQNHHSISVLADKFQQKHVNKSIQKHHFVVGTFSKGKT